jgi:hypothetical protein
MEYYDCIGVIATPPARYNLYMDYVAMCLYDMLSIVVRILHRDQKTS